MLRHIVIYTPARFIPAIISLLNLAIFTRLLSVEEYGYFALATSAALIIDGFLGQWLMAGIMRFYAEQKSPPAIDQLLASCGVLFLLPSLLVCIAGSVLLFAWQASQPEHQVLALALPYFVIYTLEQLVLRVHMASLNSARFTVLHLIQSVVSAVSSITLVTWISPDPAYAILGMISGFLLVLLIDWRTTRRFFRLSQARWDTQRTVIQFAWPTILACGLGLLASRLNRFFLLASLGPAAVGLLNAAQALTEQALASVFMIVAMAAHPMTVKVQSEASPEALGDRLRSNAVWVFGIGLPSAVGFALLSPELVTLFLGENYHTLAIPIIPWIAAAAFLNAFRSHFLAHSFFLARKIHYNLYVAVPALLLTLVANAVLIPRYGLFGAILAILIVETASTLLAFALTRRAIKLPMPFLEITRIGIATAAMCAVMMSVSSAHPAEALLVKFALAVPTFLSVAVMLNIENCREKIILMTRRLSIKAPSFSR